MSTSRLMPGRRSVARLFGTLAAVSALTLTFSGAASAAGSDFDQLLALNPGLSAAELKSSMREAAAATGLSYDQAVATALDEAQRHATVKPLSGGGSCTTVLLGTSRYAGDIFYAASSTYGISHGHTGIFSSTSRVTEARGSGDLSGDFAVSGRKYCKNIEKMDVATTVSTQTTAANYARANLTGKPYNSNFAWNKGGNIDTLNCSELVYKAYKRSVNIDLDHDGGLGVYPVDIRNDAETRTYQTVTS